MDNERTSNSALEAQSVDDAVRQDPVRLAAVRATGLLDTDIEEAFDRITRLAVRLVEVPAAFISLVDENRDFYKSACGFGEPLASTRELSGETFCHFTIQSHEPLVIPDTLADPRYRDVATVRSLGVAAYVGVPLVVDTQVIGAFCAIDLAPHAWTAHDVATLTDLAAIALSEIQLRAANKRSEEIRLAAETSRFNAEMARTRLSELFRQAPALIAVVRGPDHVFELANDEYSRLAGCRDLVGKPLVDVVPESREQGFIAALDRVLETGEPFIGREVPLMFRREGRAIPEAGFMSFVFQPLIEIDGTRSGIFVHAVDVTEQVDARHVVEALNQQLQDQAAELKMQAAELQATTDELQVTTEELSERTDVAELARDVAERASAALAASEVRYRTLTEAVPVQVWTATPDGLLDFVSARTGAYFGVPPDDALGTGWTTFVHADDLAAAATRWSEALATGSPYEAEFRLRHGESGEYRWHLVRAFPDRAADGDIVGWIGSNTDVESERRARAAAETANQAKSEFLAVMSHELRTPLNAIGGYAELLETEVRGPVTDIQRIDLERIQRSQRHLLGLINGILNYAKVDAGMMPYAVEDVSMDDVLATCESLTMPQIRDKRLALEYPRVKTRLVARADREKVQQILLNLLSNAIKFTDTGGTVTVSCTAADARILVRVSDTGHGIPTEQLERVFQPFVQIDSRLTREHPGTGLGLAISRDLARGMGGDLMAESIEGTGSTFFVWLPARQS